jgi:hypothetical protein
MGTHRLLQSASVIQSVCVADVKPPTTTKFQSLDVTLDPCLTLQQNTNSIAKTCHFHLQAIRHVRHLLTRDVANTL